MKLLAFYPCNCQCMYHQHHSCWLYHSCKFVVHCYHISYPSCTTRRCCHYRVGCAGNPKLKTCSSEQTYTNTRAACDCSEQSHAALVFVYVCSELQVVKLYGQPIRPKLVVQDGNWGDTKFRLEVTIIKCNESLVEYLLAHLFLISFSCFFSHRLA